MISNCFISGEIPWCGYSNEACLARYNFLFEKYVIQSVTQAPRNRKIQACEQALRGALEAGRQKEGELDYRDTLRKKAKKASWNYPLKTYALTKLLKNYCCNLSLLRLLFFSCHRSSVEWKSKLKVIEIKEKS